MSSKFTTPTSELDAVNVLLDTIGEAPVTTLVKQTNVDAVKAMARLAEVAREIALGDYHFNTECDWPLAPNTNGEISISDNIIDVDLPRRRYPHLDVIVRGSRLYDKAGHTYQFSDTLYGTVKILLPFEEMPEAARRYVTIRAARIFQDRGVGDVEAHQFTKQDEIDAKVLFSNRDARSADRNVLSDNYTIANMIRRGRTTASPLR